TSYWYRARSRGVALWAEYSDAASATTSSPGNTAPTVAALANVAVAFGVPVPLVAIALGDAETPVGDLELAVSTSNGSLTPQGGLTLGGSGAARTLQVVPAPGK